MPVKIAHKKGWPRSNRGWKEIQERKQANKKTRWALTILAIICGLLIFGNAVKFIKTIFNPWQQIASKRNYLWQGDFNINLLIKAKNISLLSYSPQNQKIIVFDIPANAYLEVPKGFGNWEVRSIIDLGGDGLLKETLVNFLGLPIDGFLQLTDKYSKVETLALVEQLRKSPFALISMLHNLKTDLSLFELIRLEMGWSSVRFDKIKQIDLEKASLFERGRLADGTQVLSPDTIRLDSALSELSDPIIQSEHKTIAIFNSTSHPLLALKAARLVTNLGGDVIITSNSQNKYKQTQIVGEKSKTLKRLKQIFAADDKIDPSQEGLVSSRAQINIFLGEDYFNQ